MPSVSNGFLFDDDGNLMVSQGPIQAWNGGLPFDADGRLVGTTAAPAESDPYVGGVRVSPTLGVYVVDGAPTNGDAPVNIVAPDTTGDAKIGSTLTTTAGTWTGTAPLAYAYQWYSGINPIVGATVNAYTVQASDLGNVVICRVTVTNALGGASATGPGIRIISARYNYVNNGGIPSAGWISAGSASAPLQVRINEIDRDGLDHNVLLSRIRAGDSIFVGSQEGILSAEPLDMGGYYILELFAWPLLADGQYDVTFGFNALFAVNMDNDAYEDFPIFNALGFTVTEDADSYNIDLNGDGVSDITIPKP